jgi:hypothetical protein
VRNAGYFLTYRCILYRLPILYTWQGPEQAFCSPCTVTDRHWPATLVIDQVLHAVSFETEVSVSNSGFDAVPLESLEMISLCF